MSLHEGSIVSCSCLTTNAAHYWRPPVLLVLTCPRLCAKLQQRQQVAASQGWCTHSPGRVWGAASWGCACEAAWRGCKATGFPRQPFSQGLCVPAPDLSVVCVQLLVGALVPVDGRGLFISTLQVSPA